MGNLVSATGKERQYLKVSDNSQELAIAGNIGNWCMVSNGTLHFQAALTTKGGSCEITHVIIREEKGIGSLIKADLRMIFFRNSDINTASGSAFVWTPNTTIRDVIGWVDILTSDYEDFKNNAVADSCIALVAADPPLPYKATEDWIDVLAVIVSLEADPITYPDFFDAQLIVNQD